MDEWKPDLEYIAKLEADWREKGYLDQPTGPAPEEGLCVRYFVEVYEKDGWTKIANYLKSNFDLDQNICDHKHTGQELIDAMREGTPVGSVFYSLMEAFAGETELYEKTHKSD
jgi:hypothetical protein